MRTAKKNESGILNQNLCGSNEGYETWKSGDPIGSGYTFTNVAYPGKSYSMGNVFRKQDMGNLLQLIFQCGDYFRYKDVQLIGDSHFGHIVPMSFLRLYGVFCTCSALPSRKGLSNIKELSSKKIDEAKLEELMASWGRKPGAQASLLSDDDTDSQDSAAEYARATVRKNEKKLRRSKSRIQFFERELSLKRKGAYQV